MLRQRAKTRRTSSLGSCCEDATSCCLLLRGVSPIPRTWRHSLMHGIVSGALHSYSRLLLCISCGVRHNFSFIHTSSTPRCLGRKPPSIYGSRYPILPCLISHPQNLCKPPLILVAASVFDYGPLYGTATSCYTYHKSTVQYLALDK